MRKTFGSALIGWLVALALGTAQADPKEVDFTHSPIVHEGAVLVPVRELLTATAPDATLTWDEATHTAVLKCGQASLSLVLGAVTAQRETEPETLPVAPITLDDVLYAPLRALAEVLGLEVGYDRAWPEPEITLSRGADRWTFPSPQGENGQPALRTLTGHTDMIRAIVVTPDGTRVVSAAMDTTLKVWSLRTGACLHTLRGHTRGITKLWVVDTPTGPRALSSAPDDGLRLWDFDTGDCLKNEPGDSFFSTALPIAFTPDGKGVVFGDYSDTLTYKPGSGAPSVTFTTGDRAMTMAVVVTPDGKHAISGSGDRTLVVWDLTTGAWLQTLRGHTGTVDAVAVTPDGRRAVSGSVDKTVKVWDLATGACLRSLTGHTGPVTAIAVTPDGKLAISGSCDCTLKVWDLTAGE